MSNDLVTLAPQKRRSKLTHWPGCETVHLECLLVKVSDKARALQDEVERLKALIVSQHEVVQWAADGWPVALEDHEQQAIEAIVQEAQERESAAKEGRDE